jgi:hypothetical protein
MPDTLTLPPTNRRGFLKRTAFGLGAVAAAAGLQACDSNDPDTLDGVTLDFSSDVGVLNYAYALEQLEAAFYAAVVGHSGFNATFSTDERSILRDLAAHEAIHRDFFRAAITGAAGASALIPNLTPDFSAVNFADKASVLGTALVFEDLGVSAYNGAGRYIASDDYLTLAGKIVSVEARHASVVAGLITANAIAGTGQVDANGLDKATRPDAVLTAASPFLVETITATNL